MSTLTDKKCIPCEGGVLPLSIDEVKRLLSQLNGWIFDEEKNEIYKEFQFKNFYYTMAFVNAVAWIANKKNTSPARRVGHCYYLHTSRNLRWIGLPK